MEFELADAAQTLVICPAESPCVCTHAAITADDQTADFRLESPVAEDTVESADAVSPSATTVFEPETAADEPIPPCDAGNEVLAASYVSPELMPEQVSNVGQGSELEPEDLISDSNGASAEARLEDEAVSNQQIDEDVKSCPFVMNPLENDQEDKQDTEDLQAQEVGPIEDATDQQEAREVVELSEDAVAEEAESTEDAAAYLRVRSCDEYTSVLSPIVEDVDGSRPEASEDDLMEVAGSLSEAGTPSPREEDGQKLEDPSRPLSQVEECGGGGGGIHLALMAPPAGFADSPERLRRESSMEERQQPPLEQQQLELDLEMSVEVVGETEAAEAGEDDLVEDAHPLQKAEVKKISYTVQNTGKVQYAKATTTLCRIIFPVNSLF
jgi:hypothetical protein